MATEDAASSVISFVLAGVLVLGALGAVIITSDNIARDHQTGDVASEQRRSQAEGLLSILLDSPGYTATDDPWVPVADGTGHDAGADGMKRLGLLDAQTGYLNLTKFENLRLAPYAADGGDGFVNYEEARAQLGLDVLNLDFHIRVYPTLIEVQQKLAQGYLDQNLKVTYVGDIDGTSQSAPTWTAPVCDVSPYDDNYHRVSIDVDNDGGTQTQFEAHLKITDGLGAAREYADVSRITPAGGTAAINIDFPDTSDVDCEDGTTFQVTVSDISAALDSQTYTTFQRDGTPTPTSGSFKAELDQQHYVAGDTATVWYSGVEGGESISWKLLEADDPLAAIVSPVSTYSGTLTAEAEPEDRSFTFTVPTPSVDTASHRLVVTNDDEDESSSVLLALRKTSSVSLDDYDPGNADASNAMATEIGFLEDLVQNFCPAHYNDPAKTWMDPDDIDAPGSTTADKLAARCVDEAGNPRSYPASQQGDVFWDDKEVIAALCGRLVELEPDDSCPGSNHVGTLDWTNLLIVGSHVDHNSMTKATFKWPLEAWVQAGGTVVAFGSPSTTTEWLQPIFNVGHVSSSGGISTPDSSHPLLTRPNELDYASYDTAGEGWRFKNNDAASKFTTVVKQGDDPISSISNAGAFGKGTVMVSTWLPYDPYGTGDVPDDGQAIIDNFITQAYRDLFLDYGPPIPSDQEAVPAFGRAQIQHDKLGLIDLDIALFVFPGGS